MTRKARRQYMRLQFGQRAKREQVKKLEAKRKKHEAAPKTGNL
jgi:hypothetical protein